LGKSVESNSLISMFLVIVWMIPKLPPCVLTPEGQLVQKVTNELKIGNVYSRKRKKNVEGEIS
jgi:hypothetical protein